MGANPLNPVLDVMTLGASKLYRDQKDAAQEQADKQQAASEKQAADAAALKKQMLEQPKQTTPDNFLANKNKQLNTLRMGLASTITGAGSLASTPVAGLKSKMGQ